MKNTITQQQYEIKESKEKHGRNFRGNTKDIIVEIIRNVSS